MSFQNSLFLLGSMYQPPTHQNLPEIENGRKKPFVAKAEPSPSPPTSSLRKCRREEGGLERQSPTRWCRVSGPERIASPCWVGLAVEKTKGKGLSTLKKSECHPTPGMGLEGRRGVDTEKNIGCDGGGVDSSSKTKYTSGLRSLRYRRQRDKITFI